MARVTRMARNASSLLKEAEAAEAADEDALNACANLWLKKELATLKRERDDAQVLAESRKALITQRDIQIECLRGQLEWHEKMQAYNNRENHVSCGENMRDTKPDNLAALRSSKSYRGADFAGTRYKTKMCTTWIATGKCPYGQNCHFAHGNDERRGTSADVDAADYFAIYVTNVPPNASREDLEKCFAEFGPLHRDHKLHILNSGSDKTNLHQSVACFVNYSKFESAELVLWASHNRKLFFQHAALHVQPARNTMFVLVREHVQFEIIDMNVDSKCLYL